MRSLAFAALLLVACENGATIGNAPPLMPNNAHSLLHDVQVVTVVAENDSRASDRFAYVDGLRQST